MFDNISSKIMAFASISTYVGIGSSVLIGLTVMDQNFVSGFLIAALGSLISWISSFIIYGFGLLIENSNETVRLLKATNNQQPQNPSPASQPSQPASQPSQPASQPSQPASQPSQPATTSYLNKTTSTKSRNKNVTYRCGKCGHEGIFPDEKCTECGSTFILNI